MNTTRRAAALVLLAASSNALAEDRKPGATPARPTPSKELAAFMKPLEGTWNCDGNVPAGAFGRGLPASHNSGGIKFEKNYDGFFYRGEYEMNGVELPVELPMKGEIVLGWDARAQQVLVWHFNGNGTTNFSTGKPQGNTLVTLGELGNNMKTRETHIVKSDKAHFHKFELDLGKGWVPIVEHHCTR